MFQLKATDSTVHDCRMVQLPISHDQKGRLTAVNNGIEIPFDIKRVYYLYDIPTDADRGGHAHKALRQMIVAVSGGTYIELFDGKEKKTVELRKPFEGLLIPPGLWRRLYHFTSSTVVMILASETYDDTDYIRDMETFIEFKNG